MTQRISRRRNSTARLRNASTRCNNNGLTNWRTGGQGVGRRCWRPTWQSRFPSRQCNIFRKGSPRERQRAENPEEEGEEEDEEDEEEARQNFRRNAGSSDAPPAPTLGRGRLGVRNSRPEEDAQAWGPHLVTYRRLEEREPLCRFSTVATRTPPPNVSPDLPTFR